MHKLHQSTWEHEQLLICPFLDKKERGGGGDESKKSFFCFVGTVAVAHG
jgi:hypothetical protein